MKIPEREYTSKEFIDYIQDHQEQVFKDEPRKHWLKIYCLLVSDQRWKETLFSSNELTELGEIYKAVLSHAKDEETTYYVVEYKPGLLLLFTSAKKEEYKKTLGALVKKTRGVTQMWAKPDLFQRSWKKIIESTDGYVYNFISRRHKSDETECQLRPSIQRRFNYSGEDGQLVMEELKELYGAIPESVRIRVNKNLKIHLTNRGLFSAQRASSQALRIFFDYINHIADSILDIKGISEAMKFEFVRGSGSLSHLQFPSIVSGIIKFSVEIDQEAVEKFISNTKDFSFVDCDVQSGSLKFTAIVVDENKDSVFNISATESEMLLIPKYRTTFDSFYNFYELVTENLDNNAIMSLNE
ncbi:MAG: hypothetical protein D6813_09155 [Calditrichaeota bacterium]|nr:MAG: hypothetical protein D6813_09155 [Calditrichota bacterium]